jgi:hypothetical protein
VNPRITAEIRTPAMMQMMAYFHECPVVANVAGGGSGIGTALLFLRFFFDI